MDRTQFARRSMSTEDREILLTLAIEHVLFGTGFSLRLHGVAHGVEQRPTERLTSPDVPTGAGPQAGVHRRLWNTA
jgi:hypothetical protein